MHHDLTRNTLAVFCITLGLATVSGGYSLVNHACGGNVALANHVAKNLWWATRTGRLDDVCGHVVAVGGTALVGHQYDH